MGGVASTDVLSDDTCMFMHRESLLCAERNNCVAFGACVGVCDDPPPPAPGHSGEVLPPAAGHSGDVPPPAACSLAFPPAVAV
eukprot:2642107-Amphidinium_carterae.1